MIEIMGAHTMEVEKKATEGRTIETTKEVGEYKGLERETLMVRGPIGGEI